MAAQVVALCEVGVGAWCPRQGGFCETGLLQSWEQLPGQFPWDCAALS